MGPGGLRDDSALVIESEALHPAPEKRSLRPTSFHTLPSCSYYLFVAGLVMVPVLLLGKCMQQQAFAMMQRVVCGLWTGSRIIFHPHRD